jgi:hypothetical protein
MDVQCDADIKNTKTQIRFFPDIQNVHQAQFFPPEFNIRLYDKNSESDYFFFPPPKSEYFFREKP